MRPQQRPRSQSRGGRWGARSFAVPPRLAGASRARPPRPPPTTTTSTPPEPHFGQARPPPAPRQPLQAVTAVGRRPPRQSSVSSRFGGGARKGATAAAPGSGGVFEGTPGPPAVVAAADAVHAQAIIGPAPLDGAEQNVIDGPGRTGRFEQARIFRRAAAVRRQLRGVRREQRSAVRGGCGAAGRERGGGGGSGSEPPVLRGVQPSRVSPAPSPC